MEPVLHPDEMRAADEATIASGVPGVELMERAAHACAVTALRILGGGYGRRAVVVAGTGNNGGDGIGCARHLVSAGVVTDLLLLGDPTGDPARLLERARAAGAAGRLHVRDCTPTALESALRRADVAVDAVFGTGFSGEPRGAAGDAVGALADPPCRVLSVDIPSGVSGADGATPGVSVRADVTLAIQALKIGHVVAPGAFRCGRLDVVDIGIGPLEPRIFVPNGDDVLRHLPAAEPDTHKYRAGAVAVLAGSPGMTGAAILATHGAYRSGAGIVFLGVPASCVATVDEQVLEAVTVALPDDEGQLGEKAVEAFGSQLDRAHVLAVGPGLGRGPRTVSLLESVLTVDLPLVIDGDGLWGLGEILAARPDALRRRDAPTVLTPHAGEFTFLVGRGPGQDRIADVANAASDLGAVVHLKGRRAVTAAVDGRVWVNPTGNPGLATAGSGDVLTGVLATLLAQGLDPADATWCAAHLHGLAGDVAVERLGTRPAQASDIAAAVPDALRRLHWVPGPTATLRTVLADPAPRTLP